MHWITQRLPMTFLRALKVVFLLTNRLIKPTNQGILKSFKSYHWRSVSNAFLKTTSNKELKCFGKHLISNMRLESTEFRDKWFWRNAYTKQDNLCLQFYQNEKVLLLKTPSNEEIFTQNIIFFVTFLRLLLPLIKYNCVRNSLR